MFTSFQHMQWFWCPLPKKDEKTFVFVIVKEARVIKTEVWTEQNLSVISNKAKIYKKQKKFPIK